MISPTAEPFFFSSGPIGVLLIHRFTGAPKEMRWSGRVIVREASKARVFEAADDFMRRVCRDLG